MPPEWWDFPSCLAFSESLRKRKQSMGVRVKLTSMDIMMEMAVVIPKEKKKRPTRPDMKAMGRNITTSEKVVAMTARAISLVAPSAASHELRPFSSIQRKMFSCTTTASSITIPTAITNASIVMLFKVKPAAFMTAKVDRIEMGMEIEAMTIVRQSRKK